MAPGGEDGRVRLFADVELAEAGMDPDEWIAQYDEKLRKAKRAADQATSQLGGVSGSATSADGMVTVRVNAAGNLLGLDLDRSAQAARPDRLARAIMDCVRAAQRVAAGQMVQVMTEFVGDGAALDYVKNQLPHGYAGDGADGDQSPSAPSWHRDNDDFGNNDLMR